MKPGLTTAMKEARLQFALRFEHWTLEDWKNVIWSDETSVILGHRRGGIRVWRKSAEKYDKTCMTRRWKGSSEFMFWGCFSYNKKGPFHIWKSETATEKKEATLFIDKWNADHKQEAKAEWELNTAMNRLGIARNRGGKKPQWRFTAANGAMTRSGKKGGIDWWRYQKHILKDKLIPFTKRCKQHRPGTIVQEDKAPAHALK
jgi:hypothetical protein